MDLTAISNELKLQYTELFATEFTNGAVFIWRPLSPYEYKAVRYNEKLSSTNQEHAFCMISVVYSIVDKKHYREGQYDFTEGLGGYATSLTAVILSNSGFGDDDVADNILEEYRNQMTMFENQIPCIIKAAFGSDVKFEEIETWSLRRIMYYLSRAEWMLNFNSMFHGGPGAQIPAPIMKQQVAPQQAKEKIPREEWMNWDWEEISESQFNKIAPPDAMYDPANDPNLYSRG